MYPGDNYILVQIDKKAQIERATKVGAIYINPDDPMKYYLQYGEVKAIGSFALQEFPEMKVGDIALFHHSVEDGDDRLINVLEDGDEIRYLDGSNKDMNYEVYGVIKNGELIASRQYLFAETKVHIIRESMPTSLTLVDPDMWDNEEYLLDKLKKIEFEEDQLIKTLPDNQDPMIILSKSELELYTEVINAINSMREERRLISIQINKKRLAIVEVLHINPSTSKEFNVNPFGHLIVDQKVLYPFEVEGNRFLLINKDTIEMIIQDHY